MKAVASILNQVSDWLEKLIVFMTWLAVCGLAVVLVANVLMRYFFNFPLVGADELALFLLVWVTFLGTCLSIKRNDMVAVTFLLDKLYRAKKPVLFLIQGLIFAFCLVLLFYGCLWIVSDTTVNGKSAGLQIPLWVPYMIFPFSMICMCIFTLRNLFQLLLADGEKGR